MKSRVTERGQVTIPKKLRDRLGIRPGQMVEFFEDAGRIVIEKSVPQSAMDQLYGILSCDRSTDELVDELRGPADVG